MFGKADPYKTAYHQIKNVRMRVQVKIRDINNDLGRIEEDYRKKGFSKEELEKDRIYNQYCGKLTILLWLSGALGIQVPDNPTLKRRVQIIGGTLHELPPT